MLMIRHKALCGICILWSLCFLVSPALNLENSGEYWETLPMVFWVWILGVGILVLLAVIFQRCGGARAVMASLFSIGVILWFVNLLFPWERQLMMFNPFCWPLLWGREIVALELYGSFLLYLLTWVVCLGIVIIVSLILRRYVE